MAAPITTTSGKRVHPVDEVLQLPDAYRELIEVAKIVNELL